MTRVALTVMREGLLNKYDIIFILFVRLKVDFLNDCSNSFSTKNRFKNNNYCKTLNSLINL